MSYRYSLLIVPFLLLSCKQEIKRTEPGTKDQIVLEQKKTEKKTIHKEPSEQKINSSPDLNAEWEGVYSYCVADIRTDDRESESCYDISIFKDEVTVEGNTSFCTGAYKMTGDKDEIELRYAGEGCEDHFFRLKRNGKKVLLYDFMNPDQAKDVKRN